MPSREVWQDDDDLDISAPEQPSETWLTSYGDLMTILLVFFVLLISASRVSSIEFEKIKNAFKAPEPEEHSISKIYDKLMETVQSHNLSDVINIEDRDKSIAVTLPGKMLFALGDAEIKEETKRVLQEIAEVFKELPPYARIAIEGHTDDTPVNPNTFRSNWHLSALRALAVLEFLDKEKACHGNCEVRGFGEYRPKADNRDDQGRPIATNQAQNRRVVIRVF